jgi:hypothetical protein
MSKGKEMMRGTIGCLAPLGHGGGNLCLLADPAFALRRAAPQTAADERLAAAFAV